MEGTRKEEEEGGSYNSMNVQETNKDYICSDDYHIEEEEEDDDVNNGNNNNNTNKSQAWGTWEELLLACAVKRHGLADWDSVASEVRSRSSLSHLLASANNCRHKYRDLKLRFQQSTAAGENTDAAEEEERVGNNNIPWLEQLRTLRVAELRREVERYDVSILSLQLKVKKLEEEREGNVVVGELKPDLEDERERERSENDGCESEHREKEVSAAEESDRDNRSMNESNSTATAGEDEIVGGDEPSQTRDYSGDNNPGLDPVNKDAAEEEEEGSVSRGSEASHSGESGTSEKKWKRKRRKPSGSENNHGGSGEIRSVASKSQPLIDVLDLIRSHPRGSLFERRLRSQETKQYTSLVKQHLDIASIQRKLKQGSYDSSSLSFYRDLQLLFTNAIIFFPLSSSESMAAHELRTFVSEEMRKETGKSGPKLINRQASAMNSSKIDAETSDSSLSRQKSSALVVCKKRSIVSAKASPSSSSFSQKEETKEETLSEEKENIVTGVRSSRRANKVVAAAAAVTTNNTKTGKGKNKQKQTESKTNLPNDSSSKQETGKKEKVSSEKKKSMADFLKRLKKNSPQKEAKDQKKSGGSGKKESKTKPRELRSSSVGKKKAEVENTPVKRAPGRPQKKTAEAGATATTSGKRGRDTGSTGKDNKQPKKRVRR